MKYRRIQRSFCKLLQESTWILASFHKILAMSLHYSYDLHISTQYVQHALALSLKFLIAMCIDEAWKMSGIVVPLKSSNLLRSLSDFNAFDILHVNISEMTFKNFGLIQWVCGPLKLHWTIMVKFSFWLNFIYHIKFIAYLQIQKKYSNNSF